MSFPTAENRPIFCCTLLVFLQIICASCEQINSIAVGASIKNKTSQFSSSVFCTNQHVVTTLTFQQPFHGVVYVRNYQKESACRLAGNGSRIIHFQTSLDQCGVALTQNGTIDYDFILNIQREAAIQQARDERLRVSCVPRDIILTSAIGTATDYYYLRPTRQSPKQMAARNSDPIISVKSQPTNQTLAAIASAVDCRVDVLIGRLPFLKPLEGVINIGQDITVLIKCKEIEGVSSMLSKCYAHDGTHQTKHELTDSDGCSVDTNIMPNFNRMYLNTTDSTLYFASFPAFKFPEKNNLFIQCTVAICNSTCSQVNCQDPNKEIRRFKRVSLADSKGNHKNEIITKVSRKDQDDKVNILTEIGLSNSFGVVSQGQQSQSYTSSPLQEATDDLLSCLTSNNILLLIGLLSTGLITCLMVACFLGAKVKELSKKLSIYQQTTVCRQSDLPRIIFCPRQEMPGFGYGRM